MTAYRDAIAEFVTGVALIVVCAPDRHQAMTVTSLMSVELDPPTIAVGLTRGGSTPRAVLSSGRFSLSLLAGHQRRLAELYSDPGRLDERREHLRAHPSRDGVPVGFGGIAESSCEIERVIPIALHDLIIASVVDARVGTSAEALVRHGSRYRALGRAEAEFPPFITPYLEETCLLCE